MKDEDYLYFVLMWKEELAVLCLKASDYCTEQL